MKRGNTILINKGEPKGKNDAQWTKVYALVVASLIMQNIIIDSFWKKIHWLIWTDKWVLVWNS